MTLAGAFFLGLIPGFIAGICFIKLADNKLSRFINNLFDNRK